MQVTHVHGLQHVHGVAVDFNGIRLESRLLRHEIHTALTLFLLKLERDTADRATLEYQINEHSKEFVFRMYDSTRFDSERWTAKARVELEDLKEAGTKSEPLNEMTVTLEMFDPAVRRGHTSVD